MTETPKRFVGKFFLPSEGESEPNTVPGHLVVSPGKCHLELLGTFSQEKFGKMPNTRYPRIHGALHSPAPAPFGGAYVTLLDCFTSRMSWSLMADSTLESVTANRAFVGDEHLNESNDDFVSLTMQVGGLANWLPGKVLNTKPGQSVETVPETVWTAQLADAVIEFHVSASSTWQSSKVVFSRRAEIRIKPTSRLKESRFQHDYVWPLHSLLTLAFDFQAPIVSLSYVLKERKNSWPIEVHDLVRARDVADVDSEFDVGNPLFDFPKDDLEKVFGAWMALSTRHRRVMGLIFGLLEKPPFFSEVRFDVTFKSLRLLVNRILGLPSLAAFIDEMDAPMRKLVDSPASFAQEIRDVHDNLWDEGLERGRRVYFLTEAMTWLLKLGLAKACHVENAWNSRAFARSSGVLRAYAEKTE